MDRLFGLLEKMGLRKSPGEKKEQAVEDPIRSLESFKRLQEKFGPRQDLRENGLGVEDLTVRDVRDVLICYFKIAINLSELNLRTIDTAMYRLLDACYEIPEEIDLEEYLDRPLNLNKVVDENFQPGMYDLHHYPGGIILTEQRSGEYNLPVPNKYVFRLTNRQNSDNGRHVNMYFRELGIPFVSNILPKDD